MELVEEHVYPRMSKNEVAVYWYEACEEQRIRAEVAESEKQTLAVACQSHRTRAEVYKHMFLEVSQQAREDTEALHAEVEQLRKRLREVETLVTVPLEPRKSKIAGEQKRSRVEEYFNDSN